MMTQGFAQTSDDANVPEITFEKTVYDFGTIELNGKAEAEFVFTNTGKSPLIIRSCDVTCGCTAAICPKNEPIKPGEKSSIKVTYNNTHLSSSFNKSVIINSNAKTPTINLIVKGVVANANTVNTATSH
jgi:hypothetical protein